MPEMERGRILNMIYSPLLPREEDLRTAPYRLLISSYKYLKLRLTRR